MKAIMFPIEYPFLSKDYVYHLQIIAVWIHRNSCGPGRRTGTRACHTFAALVFPKRKTAHCRFFRDALLIQVLFMFICFPLSIPSVY